MSEVVSRYETTPDKNSNCHVPPAQPTTSAQNGISNYITENPKHITQNTNHINANIKHTDKRVNHIASKSIESGVTQRYAAILIEPQFIADLNSTLHLPPVQLNKITNQKHNPTTDVFNATAAHLVIELACAELLKTMLTDPNQELSPILLEGIKSWTAGRNSALNSVWRGVKERRP